MKATCRAQFFIFLFFISVFIFLPAEASCRQNPTINKIIKSPQMVNSTIQINASLVGWGGRIGPPPVNRSDYVIEDATGQIYVSGPFPSGLTFKDKGKKVTLKAKVKTTYVKLLGKNKKVVYLEVR